MGIARPISILFSGKLLIAVCLISGLIISGSVASAAWETVGTAGFSAGQAWYTSLAFDGSTPYVAYMDGGNFFNKATVMRFNGNKWETVGTAGFSANQANYTSLAFDGSTPYVAYMDEGNSYKATVMKYDETLPTPAWVLVGTAGFSAGEAYNTSLAFDGSTPYVAYMDGGNSFKATVMKYDETLPTPAWVPVCSAGFSAGGADSTSLAFDGSTPYVAYRDGGNSYKATVMKYDETLPTPAWVLVGTAGFSAGEAYNTSLAFDGSTPYVAYMDGGNGSRATVMKYDDTLSTPAWVLVGTAGFSAGTADYISLAFYGSTPYVAYRDGGNSLKATVMRFNGNAWETVGGAGFSAGGALYTSLAFDGSTPYVTYRDGGNSDKASVMKFVAAPASTIPTLNEWGLILLSLLLAGTALIAIRRHRRTSA